MQPDTLLQLMVAGAMLTSLYAAWSVTAAVRAVEVRVGELQKLNAQLFRLVHLTTGVVAVRDVVRCGAGKLAVKLIDDYAETSGMTLEIEDLRRAFQQDDSPTPTGVN